MNKDCDLRAGSANTSPELSEWEVTKHEVARDAGGESVMRNKEEHQKG